MNDEIEISSYKKWFRKFSAGLAGLLEDIKDLKSDHSGKWKKLLQLFSYFENLPALFDRANIRHKHALLKSWFKQTLMFNDGIFRTAWLNPAFVSNYLALKEKGLLLIEQPSENLGVTPRCSQSGTFI